MLPRPRLRPATAGAVVVLLAALLASEASAAALGGADWRLALTSVYAARCRLGEPVCGRHEYIVSNTGRATYVPPMTLRVHLPEGARLRQARIGAGAPACPATAWSCHQAGETVSCAADGCVLAHGERSAVVLDLELLPDGAAPPPHGTEETVCAELEWFKPLIDVGDVEDTGAMGYSRTCGTTRIERARAP